VIVACLKWTTRPDLAGDVGASDERFAGTSEADRAALEVALRLGVESGLPVTAVTVGPEPAERALREALACGAVAAVRCHAPAGDDQPASADVADALASVARSAAAQLVVCGDHSMDRGTGSVPAFVARELGVAQALGCLSVRLDDLGVGGGGALARALHAVRRLDGGRREVLRVPLPAVVSVEGSVAQLRRAPLRAQLATASAPVEVRAVARRHVQPPLAAVAPFRPRARAMPAPAGGDVLARLRALTDAGAAPSRGETVELDPAAAAARIVRALEDWGHLGAERRRG